jgi:uncharacterized damage-inducible protein DinB
MSIQDALAAEFAHEAETTRRFLERLPDDRFGWQPHAKSFTAGALASHIVESLGWAERIFGGDGFDFVSGAYTPFEATSTAALLNGLDERVEAGTRALQAASDADLAKPWRLSVNGRIRFERPKAAAFRDFTLSHIIHHRGQLSVYLRLLDIPVPGAYGPTADERG